LKDKPMVVAANKIDALDDPERLERLRNHVADLGWPLFPVSAATGEGVPALLEAVWQAIAARPTASPGAASDEGLERDPELDPARHR
jgi:50S ribosomal subunit-associated GTPase HflX